MQSREITSLTQNWRKIRHYPALCNPKMKYMIRQVIVMTLMDSLRERILNLRTAHHLTQEDLAKVLHVSRSTVRDWETGPGLPSAMKLREIAAFFHVSMDSFFDEGNTQLTELVAFPRELAPSARELVMELDRLLTKRESNRQDLNR